MRSSFPNRDGALVLVIAMSIGFSIYMLAFPVL